MRSPSILILILLSLCLDSFAQKTKKDSLNGLMISNDFYRPVNWYLFDSLLIVDEAIFSKVASIYKIPMVSLIHNSKDSSVFYVSSSKSIIVDNVELKSKGQFLCLSRGKKNKVSVVSEKRLEKSFGLANPNGAIIIRKK